MEGTVAKDLYTSNLIEQMKNDPKVRLKDGNSIDKKGNWGWCDFASGIKPIAKMNKYLGKFKGKKKEWMEYVSELVQAVIYKHEKWEDYTQGQMDHTEMEYRNLMETPKGTDVETAERAITEIGIKQGTDHAKDMMRKGNVAKAIEKYKEKWGEKYQLFLDSIGELVFGPGTEPVGVNYSAGEVGE